MAATSRQAPWGTAASQVTLHACRSQDELEQTFAEGLQQLLPGVDAALCLATDDGDGLEVRLVVGDGCPVRPAQRVSEESWQLPAAQRLPICFADNELGELWLGADAAPAVRALLQDALIHLGTALVNLALNSEARDATDEYCATLQALEEGIVLFQEPDRDAMMARLLVLASGMVEAAASALYVLDEVGNEASELRLQQALGMPDALLESFRSTDGSAWPDCLLGAPAQIAERDADGSIARIAPDCAPPVLQSVVVLPLRYHGVQAGICVLFNPKTDAGQSDSIGRLQSFGQLAAALLHRLSLERLKETSISIGRELEIAETIQKRLVPSEAPPSERYDFAWSSLAAKNIGGDYVDFLVSDLGDIYAIVADASGHGINSALLMTSFRANYRGNAAWLEPNELVASLNEEVVHEVGPTGMFITAALLRIEPDEGQLSMCSAGHNPTMIYRAERGEVELVDSHGPPMGFMAGVDYESYASGLKPGDVVLLYTDGITEATDADLEMFGEDRLERLLVEHAGGTAQSILDVAMRELAEFSGRERHEDDVSLMVIKVR
ncbi:MAG: PP2C family protein-serine/threonine phosphatase [Planctomycetes bacterium]|nr:PP2C family protein-serine/threonine phosphatase [Planctomycetota bacterium]